MNDKDLNYVWTNLVTSLEKSLTKPIYETLISSTKLVDFKEGTIQIAVPQDLIKDWLSKHCHTLLEEELKMAQPEIKKLEFVVDPSIFTTPQLESMDGLPNKERISKTLQFAYLNPRYTFETFVIGDGNRFAHAASIAVGESPGTVYNPLFIYGGVGLGKTHLMQAIGHYLLQTRPKSKVMYITSEMFTNELINSIRYDKTDPFRNKYRNIDLLLIDDIQFLAGKERTQEEFFHTFNALYEANKQIVISSDRPPKDIPTIEERLRSRFGWGLTADIQPPDYETRIAILRKKAELVELQVPDEVMAYIASKIISNIRELEGALIRVVAFAQLSNLDISIKLVEQSLKDFTVSNKRNTISIDLIKQATAEYYSVKIDDMSAKIRTKEIANARQVAMFLCRELTSSSLPKIGEEFGGRDHTTVLHAYEKIKQQLKSDSSIEEALKSIKARIKRYSI